MLDIDNERGCRLIWKQSDSGRVTSYLLLVLAAAVAVLLLTHQWADSDIGVFRQRYVTGGGKNRTVHVQVAWQNRMHDMRGMEPDDWYKPGDLLVKVPGEFHFRVLPANTPDPHEPTWFEYGFAGAFWYVGWLALIGGIWTIWSRETSQRIALLDRSGRLAVESRVLPFHHREFMSIAVDDVTHLDINRRQMKYGAVFDLTLQAHGVRDFVVATFQFAVVAERFQRHLQSWLDGERARNPGIEFPEPVIIAASGSAPAGTTIQCQVCGSPDPDEWVRCVACDTPHHPDCWAYVGRCSTYACGARTSKPLRAN